MSNGQMEITARFSALNWSGIHLSRSSDCSPKRWWWVVQKCSKSSKWASIWSIAQQPQELWINGYHGRIHRIKLVWNPSSREVLTIVQSGGGGRSIKALGLLCPCCMPMLHAHAHAILPYYTMTYYLSGWYILWFNCITY